VLAITRPAGDVLVPTGHESLQAGDTLAVAGAHEAVEAAALLLAQRLELAADVPA